jgi:hypothetical protein
MIFKEDRISNLTDIRPLAAALIQAVGQTDLHRTLWRTRFGIEYAPVARQSMQLIN